MSIQILDTSLADVAAVCLCQADFVWSGKGDCIAFEFDAPDPLPAGTLTIMAAVHTRAANKFVAGDFLTIRSFLLPTNAAEQSLRVPLDLLDS